MCEVYVPFCRVQESVLTPHGLFRLSNPEAIVPGRIHLVRYEPLDQFATIVAVAVQSGCDKFLWRFRKSLNIF